MKKFWKKTEGFTLVELIVVIAILGILAGVGTVGYSGYVKKANMAADQQLVSQVANALTLYHYNNPTGNTGGYVVITPENEPCLFDTNGDAAMVAAFGDGWEENLSLKYNGWTDDGLLSYVLNSGEDSDAVIASAQTVANSPYLKYNTTPELLARVTELTDAATIVLNNQIGDGFTTMLNGMTNSAVTPQLNALGISEGDSDYNTVISNLLVTHVADELASGTENPSVVTQLALIYANLYAYASTTEGGMDEIDAINTKLRAADSQEDLFAALEFSDAFQTGYNSYVSNEDGETTVEALNDLTAAMTILGAVDSVSGNYTTDLDALKNADLYTSEPVQNHLNTYVGAVKTVSAMTPEMIERLKEHTSANGVTILMTGGTVAVTPAQASAG